MRFNNSYGKLCVTQDATSPEHSTYSSGRTNLSSPSKLPKDLAIRLYGLLKSSKEGFKDFTKLTILPNERLLIFINPKNRDLSGSSRKDISPSSKSP